MARPVSYEIRSQRDGTLSVSIRIKPDREYARDGFESFADAMMWVDGLRVLMDACGAPLLPLDTPGDVTTNETTKVKLAGKLGAEKLTPDEQKRRFIEAAREAGCNEDEADFDAALKRIVKPKSAPQN